MKIYPFLIFFFVGPLGPLPPRVPPTPLDGCRPQPLSSPSLCWVGGGKSTTPLSHFPDFSLSIQHRVFYTQPTSSLCTMPFRLAEVTTLWIRPHQLAVFFGPRTPTFPPVVLFSSRRVYKGSMSQPGVHQHLFSPKVCRFAWVVKKEHCPHHQHHKQNFPRVHGAGVGQKERVGYQPFPFPN